MRALDTNVLARLLLKDDVRQFALAHALLADGTQNFSVPVTVWLELVWVLEVNECAVAEISQALRALLGLPNLRVDRGPALRQALGWFEQGMDFADAWHLALSQGCDSLVSFDKAFGRKAAKLATAPAVTLL